MRLIEQLKLHPSNSRLALLIRHADRELIPTGEIGNEIPINKQGEQNSFAFGEKLKEHPVIKIFTSPIPRCVQTAEHISKGLGKELEIILTKCLGDPGLHVSDEVAAGEFYLKYGFDEMYKRFRYNEPIPGIPHADDYEKLMTEFLKTHTDENGITIFITHDSLIAFYHYCLEKTVYTKENWVNYLDGLLINYRS
jgi:broad specificity phosphatase PhoE